MRLTDLPVLILIIGLFCPLYSNQIRVISQLDAKIHRCVERRDSARFIPESFRNVCAGKGFSDLDEWKENCRAMWKLDFIEWECKKEAGIVLYHGRWSGACGKGEVYCRKKLEMESKL